MPLAVTQAIPAVHLAEAGVIKEFYYKPSGQFIIVSLVFFSQILHLMK
ncbi:hypothetical protein BpOF4_06290 [Alkalihalophilus pseudofirmus OF4]|uniref:Uncharacterized protein n=1 Tax=Alkalihalophilus pseudofirmus (strain ATCC BAA-2126 / JCM 17055 / OF4) TaxID=398511 RepID=D3FZS6_ALKPO|nr:hypothetical protein BpOF4_06290 [Alkalihalophilus pseudofirmus OF4]